MNPAERLLEVLQAEIHALMKRVDEQAESIAAIGMHQAVIEAQLIAQADRIDDLGCARTRAGAHVG